MSSAVQGSCLVVFAFTSSSAWSDAVSVKLVDLIVEGRHVVEPVFQFFQVIFPVRVWGPAPSTRVSAPARRERTCGEVAYCGGGVGAACVGAYVGRGMHNSSTAAVGVVEGVQDKVEPTASEAMPATTVLVAPVTATGAGDGPQTRIKFFGGAVAGDCGVREGVVLAVLRRRAIYGRSVGVGARRETRRERQLGGSFLCGRKA